MHPDFDLRLRALAGVIVRVGLNLQPGQPLLITDPYGLHGVHPEAAPLVEAIRAVAPGETSVIMADPSRLRSLLEKDDLAGYETLAAEHIRQLLRHLATGGAFLFFPGSHPGLFSELPVDRLGHFEAVKWQYLGPLVRSLVKGSTQWTLVPAPTSPWAALNFPQLPANDQLASLWETVFQAMRISGQPPNPDAVVAAWQDHLSGLEQRRDQLNSARHRRMRYIGPGTELTLALPSSRVWCTARLRTKRGIPFSANLPTEEIFTAPHRNSATGRIRIARPVMHAGCIIEGIQLEFRNGRVRTAAATTNSDLLQRLLATDDGADRVGEVAIVPGSSQLSWANRFHHNTLLDENASPHIALGDAYRFCSRAWLPFGINSSQIHLDLPVDAQVEFLT